MPVMPDTKPGPSEDNPWRILDSSARYDNAWITVTHHDVLKPNGEPGIYGTVHFKNLAIGIIVLDEEMNTWLVGQYRFPLGRYTWEIPEGGGDLAVDPLLSAQRELKEEAGIEAREWRLIQRMELSNSVTDELAFLFLATGLSYGDAAPEETELLTQRRMPFGEAYAMVQDGRITDSLSVAAIPKVRLMQVDGLL